VLLESQYYEVTTFFLWVLSKNCNYNTAAGNEIKEYIGQYLLPYIRAYYHHSNPRTAELAQSILKCFPTDPFILRYGNISVWIKFLNLGKDEKTVLNLLNDNLVTMDQLLDPTVSLDHVLAVFNKINYIKSGIVLKMMGSLTKVRNENESAKHQALELVKEIKANERELAIVNTLPEIQNPNAEKKQIFISYSWSNKQTVNKLHTFLKQKLFNCWIDDHQLQGGSELFTKIDDGISDCKVFIACCSNTYGASTNCQREFLLANDRKKLIIPVLVAPCDPWPPKGQMGPLLAGKLYVDLSTDEKFEKTVEQLITAIVQSLA